MNVDDRLLDIASRFDVHRQIEEYGTPADTAVVDGAAASPLGKGGLRGVFPNGSVESVPMACEPMPGGHINDSFIVTFAVGSRRSRYVLQRINTSVFAEPEAVMDNMQRVTAHLRAKLEAGNASDLPRRCLTLVPSRDGGWFVRDGGDHWRMYRYIESAYVLDSITTPAQAEAAGRAFGEFQRLTSDLAAPRLCETIADFHHTPKRYEALDAAVRADRCGRVETAAAEIEFATAHRELAGALVDLRTRGEVPERVVHNDAKITNVLFDSATNEALCVVDMDTVMPGLSLFDFGDMVRTMTSRSTEDECDLTKVGVDPALFEGLARGYVEATGPFLADTERAQLVTAGMVITLEQGVRFLADYLDGDTYYQTARPGQNLDRCRVQFKLVESLARRRIELEKVVDRL